MRRGTCRIFPHFYFSSIAQVCPTLWNPMDCSTPGLPVHHQLPEFTQTHVHRVSDAIQLSHPLSSPSPPAPNPSQHQSLFQWVNSLHEVAKVLDYWSQFYKKCVIRQLHINSRTCNFSLTASQGNHFLYLSSLLFPALLNLPYSPNNFRIQVFAIL